MHLDPAMRCARCGNPFPATGGIVHSGRFRNGRTWTCSPDGYREFGVYRSAHAYAPWWRRLLRRRRR